MAAVVKIPDAPTHIEERKGGGWYCFWGYGVLGCFVWGWTGKLVLFPKRIAEGFYIVETLGSVTHAALKK